MPRGNRTVACVPFVVGRVRVHYPAVPGLHRIVGHDWGIQRVALAARQVSVSVATELDERTRRSSFACSARTPSEGRAIKVSSFSRTRWRLTVRSYRTENSRIAYVFYEKDLSVNVIYTVDNPPGAGGWVQALRRDASPGRTRPAVAVIGGGRVAHTRTAELVGVWVVRVRDGGPLCCEGWPNSARSAGARTNRERTRSSGSLPNGH